MVVVSHDREFLDQLCNKLVETEQGVATTYKGNYTEFVKAKEEKIGQQWAAWEKQQKEMARQVRLYPSLYMSTGSMPSSLESFQISCVTSFCIRLLQHVYLRQQCRAFCCSPKDASNDASAIAVQEVTQM